MYCYNNSEKLEWFLILLRTSYKHLYVFSQNIHSEVVRHI